jgi:hypothetical protein
MNNQLPITIKINRELEEQFTKLKSLANKLEAQFNFQTMTAGWYGDEDNLIDISFSIETPESFKEVFLNETIMNKVELADDVISIADEKVNIRRCFVSITEKEQNILYQHPKLLNGVVEKKLSKVLNILAREFKVLEI